MAKTKLFSLLILICVVLLAAWWWSQNTSPATPHNQTTKEKEAVITPSSDPNIFDGSNVTTSERIKLPLSGSAPTENVNHSIAIEDIRRGCFRQDCIPSVDGPEFISVAQADQILPDDTIGIALSHKGVDRFYPFNMLVTREIVNETISGDPLLVTYCPLCGTGIVFERSVNGEVYEFGVSGMLWQSNLLMYNRADALADRNLWSQVLGTAVVGSAAGTQLRVVPSDIMKYTAWRTKHQDSGQVLNTGRIDDPYNGQYYDVARSFAPNFDEATSPLDPSAYVYGVVVEGTPKAYPRDSLPDGVTTDTIGTTSIVINRSHELVTFADSAGNNIADIEGFWFSWVAAYPDTQLWDN